MKKKIPFKQINVSVPVIEFALEGEKLWAMIDSGSELTLFNNRFHKDDDDSAKYDVELTGAGGTYVSCVDKIEKQIKVKDMFNRCVDLQLSGFSDSHTLAMFQRINKLFSDNMEVAAIIGGDMLNKWNAKIDYENNMLILK